MGKRRFGGEQIVLKLNQIEALMAQGKPVASVYSTADPARMLGLGT